MKAPNIKDYFNYREFLRDFYTEKKRQNKDYSYRVFTNKAHVGSPSHLKMVIDAQRNLTPNTIPKYIKALGLKTKKEIKLFELLVKYNQCKESSKKMELFEELIKEKNKRSLKPLESAQMSFLSQWYYLAIYVMVDMPGFKKDPKWIQEHLNFKVSLPEIKQTLENLISLGLITEKKGVLSQTQGGLSVQDEVQHMAIFKYHEAMIQLAKTSLSKDPSHLREFNGATVAIKKENLPQLKKMIRDFRKGLNELTSNESESDHVYQLNIQFFPLSKEISK